VAAGAGSPGCGPGGRCEHVEVFFQQQHVGGVLGHIGGGVDGDADVGGVQGDGVVDAVAEEGDVVAGGPLRPDDLGLVLGADPGEDGGPGEQAGELVAGRIDVGAGGHRAGRQAEVSADPGRDHRGVPGQDLDRDANGCLLAALRATGASPQPSLVLLAYAAAGIVALFPVTPGGLGIVEASLSWPGMFTPIVAGATAAAITNGCHHRLPVMRSPSLLEGTGDELTAGQRGTKP